MLYLCNRNRETTVDNNKVPWMSGLVSGLQNRPRRFESARNLEEKLQNHLLILKFFSFKDIKRSQNKYIGSKQSTSTMIFIPILKKTIYLQSYTI